MVIAIKVRPGSRKQGVESSNGQIVVRVSAHPTDGKANEAVIELLADLLKIPRSHIDIRSGHTSRYKRIDLPDAAARRLTELSQVS